MFLDQLSDEEVMVFINEYLIKVGGVNNKYTGEFFRSDNSATFVFSRSYYDEQSVTITDFTADVSCVSSITRDTLTMAHRKNMYRRFGKEYLDALDRDVRVPIENEYYAKINNLNKIIEEIREEDESIL